MSRYMVALMMFLSGSSITCFAKDAVIYGYDKSNNEIYAQSDNKKGALKFEEDYTGNPSYSFGFFSGTPAIIADGRSLHDSTIYATLNYSKNEFNIDCLYYNIKSKQNGVLIKEGVCGLNIPSPEKYSDYIDQKVNEIEENMDSVDTGLILNGKMSYLPIIIYKSKDKLLYKLYDSKQAMLDDKYSILTVTSNDDCEVFNNNPWVIYNYQDPQQAEIMSERIINGEIELAKATPKTSKINECLLHPAISIKQPKAFFYDSSFNVKKSYLIKDDKINLLSVSADGKWCNIRYINDRNRSIDNNMLCSDLTI